MIFVGISENSNCSYKAVVELGINKKKDIRTIWAVKDKDRVHHFITAYPER